MHYESGGIYFYVFFPVCQCYSGYVGSRLLIHILISVLLAYCRLPPLLSVWWDIEFVWVDQVSWQIWMLCLDAVTNSSLEIQSNSQFYAGACRQLIVTVPFTQMSHSSPLPPWNRIDNTWLCVVQRFIITAPTWVRDYDACLHATRPLSHQAAWPNIRLQAYHYRPQTLAFRLTHVYTATGPVSGCGLGLTTRQGHACY